MELVWTNLVRTVVGLHPVLGPGQHVGVEGKVVVQQQRLHHRAAAVR